MSETQPPVDLSDLLPGLPPIIAREKVEEYLGGVISVGRLRNLDSQGEGPRRIRIGRKIAYRTRDLLEWLAARAETQA